MRCVASYSHHHGKEEWAVRDLAGWLQSVFDAPDILVQQRSTQVIREHVRDAFTDHGWSQEFRIAAGYELTLFSMRGDLAFQLQTGNISRAPYDLLKLQYLYQTGRIDAAALALPTKIAASALGDNIANADRVQNELQLFDRVVTVPILLVAFE